MPKNYCIMQIWAESGKSALPICNYSQILYQFLTFTQNLKRSLLNRKLRFLKKIMPLPKKTMSLLKKTMLSLKKTNSLGSSKNNSLKLALQINTVKYKSALLSFMKAVLICNISCFDSFSLSF